MEKRYTYKWFVLAILFLGIGGGFAFMVGMSRTPFGYKYFPGDALHRTLVAHVVLAILLWLLSFAVVLWSRTFNGAEIKSTRGLALAGAFLIILAVLSGRGEAVINNYVPTIDTPLFLIGITLFYIAFTLNVFAYISDALKNIFCRDLARGALASSVIIALIMVVSMALSIFIHDNNTAPILYYERLFWIPGHIQQVMSGALFVAVLYALRERINGKTPTGPPFLRYATLAFPLSALLLFFIPFFSDPLTRGAKITAETIYGIGLGIPIFIHIIYILLNLGSRGRSAAAEKNTLGVANISLVLSVTIYTLGMAIAYSGFGNDLRVPAHYHGAVTSLTLALMGLSYYMIKDRKARLFGETIARVQPVIYGLGMVFFIIGLFVSGLFGAPRKTYGVSFTSDPVVLTALTVMGIGTLLAVIGGILFVFYMAISLFKEEKRSV